MGCCASQKKKPDPPQKPFFNINPQSQLQQSEVLDVNSKLVEENPIENEEDKSSEYDSQEIVDKEDQGDTKPARSEPNMVNQ